ncbi:MAG: C4-dicarboxylate TRAP transporter substrate-binding protein [Pseudomonadota bacterium]
MTGRLTLAVVAAAASTIALAAQAQTTLISNDPGPNRGVRAAAVNHLSTLISEKSGGALTVQNNWGGALFSSTAALDSLSSGVADMGLLVGPYVQSELPELALGGVPMIKASPWVMMNALDELFTTNETIKARLDERNLVYLNFYGLPTALLGCNDGQINSIADVDGVKISRTNSMSDLFEPLGGNMVNMPIYEVYQSMQTGLIDCTVTYGYFASATKLDELITSITPIELSSSIVLATVMNKDVFESLDAEDQAAIREAAESMHDYYGEHLGQAEAEAIEAMTGGEDGLVLKSFSEDDHSVLSGAAQPIVDKWLADADATGLNGQEILDEMLSLIEKWNDVEKTQGVPWERS